MIVLVAHGTRDPEGARVIERLVARVRARGVAVRVAFADVRQPDVTAVLDGLRSLPERAVVVPAFLAAGYHVRSDIPAQVARSSRPRTAVSRPFGPAPVLLGAVRDRLREAGYREGDAVVLAAAGSSDERALAEVNSIADSLAGRLGTPVRVGYAATATPTVADAVATARRAARGGGRVAVASWLLAPGLFQRRLADAGADVVAAPLGDHPAVADLVLGRYAEALPASPPLLPASPPLLPASPPLLPASPPLLPASSALLPASSALLPASSALLPASSALLPASSALLGTSQLANDRPKRDDGSHTAAQDHTTRRSA
ncbi:sirohydrochlorin ferrochelatase [Saccharomonospora amisosensis]|uniref:Sirohydrochlorin ferrochelatase n=1 Tax=Saccharomonospora amisosensis TaxID=1128677 RepID=A0A7X5UTI8_9PSEU|nr:sirohydrochlorin chelatase [Saccharomonospora amisosensis]NIJ13923.1 sirohydrochlorin ferrochelatase [Saccharomonospora amisosensis]